MVSTEQLDTWMTDIASIIEAGNLRRIGETTWWFDLDEYTDLEVKLEADGTRLVFTSGVGTPIEGEELKTYEALLIVNGLRQETGGIRMALDGPGGSVDMIFELPLEGLEELDVQHRIERFIGAANQWRAIIASKVQQAEGEEGPDMAGMIRV